MIIEIDHLALSCLDFVPGKKALSAMSYDLSFEAYDVINLPSKKELLSNYHSAHDIALLTSSGNYGIELVNHRNRSSEQGYIIPILENLGSNLINTHREMEFAGKLFYGAYLPPFNASVLFSRDSSTQSRLNKIAILVDSVEESIRFWEYFGFRKIMKDHNQAFLEFKSYKNNSYFIYLRESSRIQKKYFLDNVGCNCIAFISTDIEHDWKELKRVGVRATSIEKLKLNDKFLQVFFTIGPSTELVEVVGVPK